MTVARCKPDEKALSVHIGNRIKLRRTILGLSQNRLGKLLDITFQQVQKYERGTNRISAARLYLLAQKLDVDIQFFFDGIKHTDHPTDGRLSTRGNLEAMRSLQQLPLSLRHAVINLIHALR